MTISNDKVKKIQSQTINLGELILSINPITDKEWDAFEKLVGAHKNLMKIDTDSLLQLELPLKTPTTEPPNFRKDCPRCKGKGQWRDPDAPDRAPRFCNCDAVEDIAWPNIKIQWETELAPAEV